jgi:hypothetical protein
VGEQPLQGFHLVVAASLCHRNNSRLVPSYVANRLVNKPICPCH